MVRHCLHIHTVLSGHLGGCVERDRGVPAACVRDTIYGLGWGAAAYEASRARRAAAGPTRDSGSFIGVPAPYWN